MAVTPAYEAKYHTYAEMASYLTAWTEAYRKFWAPQLAPARPDPRLVADLMPHQPPLPVCFCAAEICELGSAGTSSEGRDLMLMTLTDLSTGSADSKPAFWLDGNTHAGVSSRSAAQATRRRQPAAVDLLAARARALAHPYATPLARW